MNSDRLKEILEKIPFGFLAILYGLYLGYEFYTFENDAGSPLGMKHIELNSSKETNKKLSIKLKQSNEFIKNLEMKKTEVRQLASELQDLKASLSEIIDIPAVMKTAITEAKKVGLTVLSLKPTESSSKEFYAEQAFVMTYRGAFAQVIEFMDRLSNLNQIIKVENYSMKPAGSASAKFVELDGSIQIKAYRYVGSKADSLGKAESKAHSTGASVPAAQSSSQERNS